MTGENIEEIPGSPIAGQDGLPVDVGRTEMRRARASVEIYYRIEPDEYIDIQALIMDALDELGHGHARLGNVLVSADLTEHVRFVDGAS